MEDLFSLVRWWIDQDPEAEHRSTAAKLLARAPQDKAALQELQDAFGGRLAFGTAGLRAAVGAGPRRLNRTVIAQTTAGLADFLFARVSKGLCAESPSVIIGFDARP